MVDLIPKNTDEEMLRYQEAERMLRARIPMKNNAALVYEADPITGRENAYSRLPSGGYVKIGDRAVTPVEAAKADAMVAAPMAADIDSFSRDYKTNFGSNPVMEDYLAANFTEAQTREYFAQRQVESLSQPGMQVPVKLNPEQIQMGVDVGAPMIAPQAVTNRESFTDFLAGSGQSEASKFLSQVYEAIGLDSYESRRIAEAVMGNPNATRDIGIGLVDLTPAGLFFGAEEGYNTFLQGYNAGDPMTAGLGALEAGLSVLEAAPLTGAGIKALRKSITPAMRQAIDTLKADAIGAGRAIAQGDTEMLGEVFQRGRPPQSLSAAAVDTETAGAITAFHGSPYDFDAFDIGKMGTGEGKQAYGPGLYFAEAEGVAKEYRDSMLDARIPPLNDKLKELSREMNEISSGYRQWKPGQQERGKELSAEYDKLLGERSSMRGRLYQVNIKANPEDFLNWDAPIGQQSEKVRQVLMPFVEQRIAQMGEAGNRFTAEQWMDRLRGGDVMLLDKVGDTPVSKAMVEAGVPGVRYLDQASRRGGDGTRNYVVFDDQLVDIVKKYGVAGLAVGAAVQSELGVNEQIEESI